MEVEPREGAPDEESETGSQTGEQEGDATGGEGAAAASVTPEIADDAEHEQTSHPAPADDVGVPSDEELGKEGAVEGE